MTRWTATDPGGGDLWCEPHTMWLEQAAEKLQAESSEHACSC